MADAKNGADAAARPEHPHTTHRALLAAAATLPAAAEFPAWAAGTGDDARLFDLIAAWRRADDLASDRYNELDQAFAAACGRRWGVPSSTRPAAASKTARPRPRTIRPSRR